MIRTLTTSSAIDNGNLRLTLRERRRAAHEATKKQRRQTRNRRQQGLRTAVQTVAAKPKAAFHVPIHALGAMVELAETLKHRGTHADAATVSNAALAVLLRTWWALVSGRPNVNPSIEHLPSKLHNRGAIDLQTLRLLRNMTDPQGKPPIPSETLLVCRLLIDLIRAHIASPAPFDESDDAVGQAAADAILEAC